MQVHAAAPPDLDLARIRRWARARIPDEIASKVQVEIEVHGLTVTIVERRPPWQPDFGQEWSRNPIAQLRFDAVRSTWALFWPRATGRWLRHATAPTPNIERLLAEIDADPDGVFWG